MLAGRMLGMTGSLVAVIAQPFVLPVAWSSELPSDALSKLESQEFREREIAQNHLLKWGRMKPELATVELFRQSQTANDPEVRSRCMSVLRDLVMDEYLKEGEGYIGIALKDEQSIVPGDPKLRGVIRVTEVRADGPGQHAGIQLNDLIIGLNGEVWHEIDPSAQFREKIRMMKPNTKVRLRVLRDEGVVELTVNLARRPLLADVRFFNGANLNPEAGERAAKEAYFRRWISQNKSPK